MKRIFAIVSACCLCACASQPQTASNQDIKRVESAPIPVATATQDSSARVYLDDYDLLHKQAAPSKRKAIVLGSGSN